MKEYGENGHLKLKIQEINMSNIIERYWIKAKKSLWQNFLVNDKLLDEMSDVIDITWWNIVEVGPWYWALTEKILLKDPKSLTLIELDNSMIDILKNRLKNWELQNNNVDFSIINQDVLNYSWQKLQE